MPSPRNPPFSIVKPGPGRLPANTVTASALIFPPGGGSSAALTAHITDPVDAHMASAIGQAGYTAVNATWVESVAGVGGTQNALTKLFDSANARPTWVLDANPLNKGDFVGPNALINAVAAAGVHNPNIFLRPGTYNWNDAVPIGTLTIIGGRRDTTIIQNLAGDLRASGEATFKNLLIQLSGDLKVLGGFGFGLNRFEFVTFDVTGDIQILSALNTFEHVSGLDGYMDIQASGPGTTLRDFVNITVGIAAGCVNNKIEDGILTSVRNAANPVVDVLGDSNTVSNIYVGGLTLYNAPIVRVGGVNNSVDTLDVTDTTPDTGFQVVQFDGAQTGTVRGVNVHACPDFGVVGKSLFEFTNSSINCTLDTVRLDDLGSVTPIAFPLCGFPSGVNESNSLSNWEVSNISLGTFAFAGVDIIRISTLTAKNLRIDRINVSGVTGSAGGKPIYIDGATVDPSNTISIQNCNLVGYGNAADAGIFIADCGANIVIDGTYCSTVTTTSYGLRVSNTRSLAASDCVFTAGSGRAALSANSGARYTRCKFIGGSANPNAGTKLFAGYGSSSLLAPNNPTAPMVLKDCIMEYGISNTAPVTGVGGGEAVIFFGGISSVAATNHGPTDIDGLSIAPGSSVVNQHRDGLVVVDILAQDPAAGPGSYKNISIDLKEKTWVANGAGRGFTPFGPGAVAAVFQMWGDTDSGSVPIAGGVFNTTGALLENLSISNVKEGDAPLDDHRHMFSAQGVRIHGLAVDGPTSGAHGTSGFCEAMVRLRGCTASNIRIGYEVGIKLKTISPLEYLYLIESVVDTVDIRVGVSGSLCNYLCRMEGSTLTKALLQNDNSASTMTDVGLQISGFSQLANYADDVEVFVNSTLSSTKCLEVLTITAGAHISNTRASCGPVLGLAGQECLRIVDSQKVTVSDSTFTEAGGRAGTVQNSGATLERVTFIGDNGTPAAGTQLFTGWGGATDPLVLRDCVMEYGSSNCNAASGSGTGEPVIFFGGIGGTATANHGPSVIDGLSVSPGSSVVNQHRDDLIAIDLSSQLIEAVGSYKNISIDLKEKTWLATGSARGVLGDASVLALEAPFANAAYTACLFENLAIFNIKENDIGFNNTRHMLSAQGVRVQGVTIDGPLATGVHGTDGFTAALVTLSGCLVSSIRIGDSSVNGLKIRPASAGNPVPYLDMTRCLVNTIIVTGVAGSLPTYLCRMSGSHLTNVSLWDNSATLTDTGGVLASALEIQGSSYPSIVDDLRITIETALSVTRCIQLLAVRSSVQISHAYGTTTQSGATGQEALRIINSSPDITVEEAGQIIVRDSRFLVRNGRGGTVQNSGATLERVEFIGADNGTGKQLFTGWGYGVGLAATDEIAPLIIRDCVMSFGPANCGAGTAGHPMIFLGGILGASVASRGPIHVDGLQIRPNITVSLTPGLPHNTILAMSAADSTSSTIDGVPGVFDNITVDLEDNQWLATGAGRSTLIPSALGASAAIVEISGFRNGTVSPTIGASCRNLRITGIVEPATFTDNRFVLNADGVSFQNVTIVSDISTGGTFGFQPLVGAADAGLCTFGQCIVNGLFLGTSGLPRMDGSIGSAYLKSLGSHLSNVVVGLVRASSIYDNLVNTGTTRLSGVASVLTGTISNLECPSQTVTPSGAGSNDLLDFEFGCRVFENSRVSVNMSLPSSFLNVGSGSRIQGNTLTNNSDTEVRVVGAGSSIYGNRIVSGSQAIVRMGGAASHELNSIVGNTLLGDSGGSATLIDLRNGSGQYNTATGNTLRNTGVGGISIVSIGTGNIAVGNTGY